MVLPPAAAAPRSPARTTNRGSGARSTPLSPHVSSPSIGRGSCRGTRCWAGRSHPFSRTRLPAVSHRCSGMSWLIGTCISSPWWARRNARAGGARRRARRPGHTWPPLPAPGGQRVSPPNGEPTRGRSPCNSRAPQQMASSSCQGGARVRRRTEPPPSPPRAVQCRGVSDPRVCSRIVVPAPDTGVAHATLSVPSSCRVSARAAVDVALPVRVRNHAYFPRGRASDVRRHVTAFRVSRSSHAVDQTPHARQAAGAVHLPSRSRGHGDVVRLCTSPRRADRLWA